MTQEMNCLASGGGVEISPSVIGRAQLWGYHDGGYTYQQSWTIDTSKHYLVSIVRLNALNTNSTSYTEGTDVINVGGATSGMDVTISGTTLTVDMNYSRDYYCVELFQLD